MSFRRALSRKTDLSCQPEEPGAVAIPRRPTESAKFAPSAKKNDSHEHAKDQNQHHQQIHVIGQPGFLRGRCVGEKRWKRLACHRHRRLCRLRAHWFTSTLGVSDFVVLFRFAIKTKGSAFGNGKPAERAFL